MSIKSLSIALMTLALSQQISAWAIIGDRHATSPASSSIEKRANYQCNFYSDSSCSNYIGHAVASGPFGKCQSGWGSANSYLCFNNNDVEQIDMFYGSNCEDDTINTGVYKSVGCTRTSQTIRSANVVGCNDVDGSEC
jgi:hypothetical protein